MVLPFPEGHLVEGVVAVEDLSGRVRPPPDAPLGGGLTIPHLK